VRGSDPTTVTVGAGESRTAVAVYEAYYTFTLRVVEYSTGSPVASYPVRINGVDYTTDSQGMVAVEVLDGDTVTIEILESGRYRFYEWWDGGTANPRRFTITASTTVMVYVRRMFQLTITVNPPEGGTTSPAPGTYWYWEGVRVEVEAFQNPGYGFKCWKLDGSDYGSTLSVTVFMDEDHLLEAVFVPQERAPPRGGLNVASRPVKGVPVEYSGSYTGTGLTDFSLPAGVYTLRAPEFHVHERLLIKGYYSSIAVIWSGQGVYEVHVSGGELWIMGWDRLVLNGSGTTRFAMWPGEKLVYKPRPSGGSVELYRLEVYVFDKWVIESSSGSYAVSDLDVHVNATLDVVNATVYYSLSREGEQYFEMTLLRFQRVEPLVYGNFTLRGDLADVSMMPTILYRLGSCHQKALEVRGLSGGD